MRKEHLFFPGEGFFGNLDLFLLKKIHFGTELE
jgi:hypothetical protein